MFEFPELFNVFYRTLVMYIVVVFVMRFTGKRQIGELQIGEVVVTFMISELASMPIQNTDNHLLYGVAAIVLLVALEVVMSRLSLKSVRVRKLFEGKPNFLMENGVINQDELRKVRFSIDDLTESLRQNGVMSIEDASTVILETNGRLSVFPKAAQNPPTAEDLAVQVADQKFPHSIISGGRFLTVNMDKLGVTQKDVERIMRTEGYSEPGEIFYMTLDEDGNHYIVPNQLKRSRLQKTKK